MQKGTTHEEILDDLKAICWAMAYLREQGQGCYLTQKQIWQHLGFNNNYQGRKWLYYRLLLLRRMGHLAIEDKSKRRFRYRLLKSGEQFAKDFM